MLLGQVPQGWKPGGAAADHLRDGFAVMRHMSIASIVKPQDWLPHDT